MFKKIIRMVKPSLLAKSISAAVVLSLLFSIIPFQAECEEISTEVFRLHILANSDSDEDQTLKLKVRDAVLKETQKVFEKAQSKTDALNKTSVSLTEFERIAESVVAENGYDYNVGAEITNMYFDTRYYDGITMPAGYYDALRITIGNAEGQNWWCVMYPGLCIGPATDKSALKENVSENQYEIMDSNGDLEYKFKVVELFEWFGTLFR